MSVEVGTEFKPGQECQASGIYKVIHDPAHTENHEVTCIYGKKFPPCRDCAHPRFRLVRAAIHVESHSLFKK